MRRHMFTFSDIKDDDIFEFFARMGYCPWKKYEVFIQNKNDYCARFVACGKGNFEWDLTLTHVGLHTLTNIQWIKFLYNKYGEPYRKACVETFDEEMFII